MRNPRIYTPLSLAVNSELDLPSSAVNHVVQVLRMNQGDSLILFNGEQGSFQGQIVAATKKNVTVRLNAAIENYSESPLRIELGQVISRGERMSYAIQKATEMGITDITPLLSERCEVKLNAERQEKKRLHWQHIAISACEQSGRNQIPTINKPVTILQWLNNRATELNFVLHRCASKKLQAYSKPLSVSLLIGPEGGLTPEEITLAEHHRFNMLGIGPRVLRTETAPIVAASILHYLWGDLR
ncbi:MAG: 16S rRNA (uracil(1498)-N(3))-methyltransferase [Endozoicomonas sp. (ex Botrylloides leachii)]|nr:16S rRNA (uracil(1498)-N(3))-methyltransferase [Endozoicomonas sp. (ex Botrylloides leachii)]